MTTVPDGIRRRAQFVLRHLRYTGPLVAFFDRSERHHLWAANGSRNRRAAARLRAGPTETIYLLGAPKGAGALFGLLQNGALVVAFRLEEHISALHRLLRKYRGTPMSLADAGVVRMAEIHENHSVLTSDSDITVYRKHGRVPITVMHRRRSALDRTNA